jgi:hypothetical protein
MVRIPFAGFAAQAPIVSDDDCQISLFAGQTTIRRARKLLLKELSSCFPVAT